MGTQGGTAEAVVEDDDKGNDGLEDDDDEFLQQYREKRLQEMQQTAAKQQSSPASSIQTITREEWKVKVNEASMSQWVLVTLVNAHCCDVVRQELHQLAREYFENDESNIGISLLLIEATDAIPNWPPERVPTLFAYHQGLKSKEWIASRPGEFPSATRLFELLYQWGVYDNMTAAKTDYDDVD